MSGETSRRRLPPSVYRRRRIVLLLALVAIGAVVWLLIAQPWSGAAADRTEADPAPTQAAATDLPAAGVTTPTPSGTPTPEQTADAAPVASATPDATATPTAKPCVSRDIAVEPLTDLDTYEPGQNPQLSIRLTNNGPADCTLNVGTSGQSFTIMSGTDIWWRSTDCQTEPSDMVVLLAAGQSVSSAAPLTWDRTRSAVGTCGDADRQVAPGGGASYHLSVEIGGIASTQSAQMLLY
jgi:zona occludens toxin (predicted ATPase)